MKVGELKEALDDYGDEAVVRVVHEDGEYETVFVIDEVDYINGAVQLDLERTGGTA